MPLTVSDDLMSALKYAADKLNREARRPRYSIAVFDLEVARALPDVNPASAGGGGTRIVCPDARGFQPLRLTGAVVPTLRLGSPEADPIILADEIGGKVGLDNYPFDECFLENAAAAPGSQTRADDPAVVSVAGGKRRWRRSRAGDAG